MSFILSPNMNLSIPGVGTEPGPQYAQDVNTSLQLIDMHDHSPGRGVQVTPAGLNINALLSFQNNPATDLAYVGLEALASATTAIQSLSSAPASSINELWYTDSNGTSTQITANGIVNATAAAIPGESYAAGTFYWTQAQDSLPTTPANFDIGSITLRPNVATTTNGVELVPPTSTATSFTFPSYTAAITGSGAPGATSFVQMDTSSNISPSSIALIGGITGTNIASNTVSRTNQTVVGQVISSSSGSFTFHYAGVPNPVSAAVTNLSVTLTTTGRPVVICLQSADNTFAPGGPATAGIFMSDSSTGSTRGLSVALSNNGSTVVSYASEVFLSSNAFSYSVAGIGSGFMYIDTPSAGTQNYSISVYTNNNTSSTVHVTNMELVAYEL